MRALIVDDERIEREGIRYLIREQYDIELLEAANGRAALKTMEQSGINILFTDIKMPFMDGLELIRIAHKHWPDMEIVVFSAYGEFEYARQAMQYGVEHYLLKPIDVDEFNNVLKLVMKKLEEHSRRQDILSEVHQHRIIQTERYEGKRFVNTLLYGEPSDVLSYLTDSLGLSEPIMPLILQARDGQLMEKTVELHTHVEAMCPHMRVQSFFEEERCCFLLESRELLNWSRTSLDEFLSRLRAYVLDFLGPTAYIVHGQTALTVKALMDEFRHLYRMKDAEFYEWNRHLLSVEDECSENVRKQAWEISRRIRNAPLGKMPALKHEMETLFELCRTSMPLTELELKQVCTDVMRRVGHEKKLESEENQHLMLQLLGSSDISELCRRMERFLQYANEDLESEAVHSCVREILNIIDQEYASALSVEDIARRVYMTPNYVSSLFKQMMGVGLVRYMTHTRLEKAKLLLETGNMKVQDIARSIGYENVSYFCMLFRNEYGESPAKYREGMSANE